MECVYNHNGITCACATDGLKECRYKSAHAPKSGPPINLRELVNDIRRTDLSKPQGYIHATTPPGPRHCIPTVTPSAPSIRSFDTGATRDLDASKYDYEAFMSPLVIEAFGRYMHGKRKMADGSLRDGDNWQKGIPRDSYMKSGWRHFMDWWCDHRGRGSEAFEETLCALLFNVQGYLHEYLKSKRGH